MRASVQGVAAGAAGWLRRRRCLAHAVAGSQLGCARCSLAATMTPPAGYASDPEPGCATGLGPREWKATRPQNREEDRGKRQGLHPDETRQGVVARGRASPALGTDAAAGWSWRCVLGGVRTLAQASGGGGGWKRAYAARHMGEEDLHMHANTLIDTSLHQLSLQQAAVRAPRIACIYASSCVP